MEHDQILTAKGGPIDVGDDLRPILCLLANGKFYVVKTHIDSPMVRSIEQRAKRLFPDMVLEKVTVDLEAVKKLYDGASSVAVGFDDTTKMQKEALALLARGSAEKASDIHIRVSKTGQTTVWMRIQGDLIHKEEHSYQFGEKLCSTLYMTLADVADTAFKPMERQDARIGASDRLPKGLQGVRIATSPQVGGFVMVMRLLYGNAIASDEDLDLRRSGYTDEHVASINKMKARPHGVTIIAGPTGSGKSTTLSKVITSYIREMGSRVNVITVENPPEYEIPGAVQTPVIADSPEGLTRAFAAAISSAMRQDPDAIMIGEVRDPASALLSIQAAMTGHLVFCTVHANSAIGIIDRMADLLRDVSSSPLTVIADTEVVSGLICQRLGKTLCKCKKPLVGNEDDLAPDLLERINQFGIDLAGVFLTGDGCSVCGGTGIKGRTGLVEMIAPDFRFFDLVKSGNKQGALRYWHGDLGGRFMVEHAAEKVALGIMDPRVAEEAVGPLTLNGLM